MSAHRPHLLALLLLLAPTTAQSFADRIEAEAGGVAIGEMRGGEVNLGPSEAELRILVETATAPLERLNAAQRTELQHLGKQLDITEDAARRLLVILGERDVPDERLATTLVEIAERHRETLRRLAALAPEDPAVAALVSRAETGAARGDYEGANRLLDEAEALDLAAVLEVEALLQEAQAAVDRRRLSAAESRSLRGDFAATELDYRTAAGHFRAAAELVPDIDDQRDTRLAYLDRAADALYRLGLDFGDNAALNEAIVAYRALLADRPRPLLPVDWAMTQNNLGNALLALGERETGSARMKEAVAAHRAALMERSREHAPDAWAQTQNNLGLALWRLGERQNDIALVEQAVAAYRAALEAWTRERAPLDWAMTQNNLGSAMLTLGRRVSGTGWLEAAVATYRAALGERTRERAPRAWAQTQNNLGFALSRLGELENSIDWLEEAVAAYRAALEELPRERVPLDWAMTQNNLGNALRALGERETGTVQLDEAAIAFRAALEEYTRERLLIYWADIQNNLCWTMAKLGERRGDVDVLLEAASLCDSAVRELSPDVHATQWADTQDSLGFALLIRAELTRDLQLAVEARSTLAAALAVRPDSDYQQRIARADVLIARLTDTVAFRP